MKIASDFTPDEFSSLSAQEKSIVVLAAIFCAKKHLCTICHERKAQSYDNDDNRICWECADKLLSEQAS